MRKTKIKAISMIIAQVQPGTEVEAIIDPKTGTIYLPSNTMDCLIGGSSSDDDDAPKKSTKATKAAEDDSETEAAPKKRGRKPAAKKEDDGDDATAEVSKKEVKKLFTNLDAGKITEDELSDALNEMTGDKAVRKKVTKLVDEFIADADSDIDETVDAVFDLLSPSDDGEDDDEAEDEAPKSKRGRKPAASKKPKSLTEDDLLEMSGESVIVTLSGLDDDDNEVEDDYPAEVRVKKGVVTFHFDDGDKQEYDPESHIKVVRA